MAIHPHEGGLSYLNPSPTPREHQYITTTKNISNLSRLNSEEWYPQYTNICQWHQKMDNPKQIFNNFRVYQLLTTKQIITIVKLIYKLLNVT